MRPTSAEYTSQGYKHARRKNRKTRAQQLTHKTVKQNKNTTTHTSEISSNIIQKDILDKDFFSNRRL